MKLIQPIGLSNMAVGELGAGGQCTGENGWWMPEFNTVGTKLPCCLGVLAGLGMNKISVP